MQTGSSLGLSFSSMNHPISLTPQKFRPRELEDTAQQSTNLISLKSLVLNVLDKIAA